MSAYGYTLFDTTIGRCGIAWSEGGIVGVQLPETRERDTLSRLLKRHPDATQAAPPPAIQQVLDNIVALLAGESADLSVAMLDMQHVSPFHRRVYEAARAIAPGETLSYGEIAEKLGASGSARAVGQALGRNPFAVVVPCHRVLAAGGKMGGFSANGGIGTKLRMLSIESARVNGHQTMFEGDGAFGFDPVVAVEHLRESSASMARLIDTVGPLRMRLKRTPSIFVALAEAIVYQQLTGRAAATIYARVCALFPRAHEGPTPEKISRVSAEKLRAAGLSNAKVLALKDLARKSLDGAIPTLSEIHGMDDEAIIERLVKVRGIGRWTVEMLLMFRLGRPDILPVDDYGVRKGYTVAFRKRSLPAPKALAKLGMQWKPYRTAASWYFWRALELPKK